jgi:cytochrome c-type biogenesis protein CcmH/NrfG
MQMAARALPCENAAPRPAPARRGGNVLNRYTIIGLAIGLVVGIFIGYQAGSSSPSPTSPSAVGMPPTGMPGGMPPPQADNVQARITALQQVVARDPKNVQAWVQLGNDYFDTRQPQKAIEAYGRALELRPDDANVLTDQGVMYRDVGQFDKALANFEKANKADPKHVQSLFNMGVVFFHDLRQPKKAIEAWTKVIQIAPQSEQAAQARGAIEEAKRSGG